MRLLLGGMFLIFTSCFALAKTETLTYGIVSETNSPFLELDSSRGLNEITGGILKNIADALAQELKIKTVTMVLIPQKRIGPSLISGDISMVCFSHESWFPPTIASQLLWSDEIFTNTNYIVAINAKPVQKVEDLFGKQVGTNVNYYYKKLDPYFEKNKITKDPGPNSSNNIKKLTHGRIDYLLISNLEFDFYKKKHPNLRSYDIGLDTVKVKCALSKKASITLEHLNKAIAALKKNHILEKIFTL